MKKTRKRIMLLSLLFVLSLSTLFIAANSAQGGSSIGELLSANAESKIYALTPEDDVPYIENNNEDLGISPMGWWEDLWNIAEEINVYGTVHAGDKNTNVSSGSYTNKAYGYTAPSGFPQYQMKGPNDSGFNTTVLGSSSMWSSANTDGWYYFRGYKPNPKGDYTKQSSICLDTVKPQIQARINGSSVANGSITTSSSAVISILGSDERSGVDTYWYTMSSYGGTYYQCYSSSTFSSDGVYTFYCKDRAGNVSDTVTVTKDTVAPTVKAYNGSTAISNGAIVNASSARFEATDSTSGVSAIYIRTPGSSSYTNYGTSASISTVGLYYYYAKDKAGNQSSTYTFTIDRTAPTATLYSGTTSVSSGYYSAASYIRFTASDTNGCTIYMKKDSGSYSTYTSGTNQTAEGVYSFYAVDPAGNSTSTYTITLDRTAPVGTLYAGTTVVTSGKITNASYIKYTATDNLALNVLYVRIPGSSSYVSYTSGTQYTADGTYYFYATDKSGNTSTTVSIVLDKTKPMVAINATSGVVASGSFTNSASVKFTASDATSGVANMYIRLPGSSSYISYVAGTPFTTEGIYYVYATDVAGNTSDTVNVTVDRTLPVGTLTANSSTVTSGTFTNKAFYYTATDTLSGVAKCEIKRPGGSWETYTSGTSIASSSTQGLYSFRSTDKAGNVSTESLINLVTTAPAVTIYAGTTVVSSGSFTNSSYVTFSATGYYGATVSLFVKIPGASSFTSYTSGTQLTKEGLYSFYATDNAGNTSATVTVTLDITKPIGTLTSNGTSIASGSFTDKAFNYTATDSGSGISKCEIKKPGGSWETYISGTTIAASATQGLYTFRATDKAGNVSQEMTINLVTSAPVVTIYAETTAVASGSYTNKSYVAFTATVSYGATVNIYVKMPGSSSFALYAAGTQLSKEGKYEVYAIDNAGNTSATVNITLDITKPTGTLTANGVTVTSGSFTNKAFAFTATDNISGLSKCEIKRPSGNWETYTSGTSISATGTQGLYTFRATDNAGNISAESQINLVTSAPVITLYAAATTASSGSFTNKSYVAFTVMASFGATASLYVKMPDASSFTLYAAGTQLSKEGKYEVYATDNAGNTSSTLNITRDSSSPVGTITSGGKTVGSGDYVNAAFKYSATDSISGISKLEILRPSGTWQTYGGEEISIGSGNGLYSFRATDKAGNVSAESKVNLLTNVPSVQLYADEQIVTNGTFTNAARISMSASGGTSLTCYVKIPGASSFIVYNQYYAYTAIGRYEFYCEDQAGNSSGVFTIIIDRTTKAVTLTGVTGTTATGDVSATWGSGSTTIASIVSVTVNGISYSKNTVIKTIGGGVYNIKTVDAAGNVWTFTFTAVRTEILSETTNKQYYESKNAAGSTYAFENYENALNFAKQRENSYVRTATWNGSVWDGGIAIDSIDSPNAKNGTYYIYKKSGDSNTEVAYFTLARLNAVIAEYATESITSYFWWEKSPAQSYTGNDLIALKSQNVFIGSSITLASHAKYLIDGQALTGLTYMIEGVHTLKVYDDYGNSYEYTLKIVRRNSDVSYMVEGGTWNMADPDRQYRLSKAVTIKAADLIDEYAMFYVKNSAGVIIAKVDLDTEYLINKSGQYSIVAVNHFGSTKEISFILSLNGPTAAFINNVQTKRLELKISSSIDSTASISDIKIYRSTDNGKTWVLLSADDYENDISKNRLSYEFNKDGSYRVVIEDNFRTGMEAVTFEADYSKPDPSGSLIGVTDGGYTNTSVRFVWSDEATVYLTYNGATTGYLSGTEITAQGMYVLEFRDDNGYCKVYMFTIDTVKPTGTIMINGSSVQSGGYTNKAFSYTATDNLSGVSKCEIKRPGGSWEVYNGEEIKANSGDGNYSFRVYDKAGNISVESLITLVTSKPTVSLYAGADAVASGTNTNKSYVTFTASSVGGVTMYVKTPNASEYTAYAGAQLTGEGTYYFYAVDAAGNVSETLTVTLDKSSPVGSITAGGVAVDTGSYTNKAFKFTATDNISGIARFEMKRPGGSWEVYSGDEIKANSGDGYYAFRAFDIAGNVSAEIGINLITALPVTKIYAGADVVISGTNSNKNYVTFAASSGASVTMYVKLPGAGNYTVYTGTQLAGEGIYYFYAVDITGNTSETVSITLDKTKPIGSIITESVNGYTNKAFSYSATDSLSGVARYEIKRLGGNWEVYNGEEIKANSGDGIYGFRAIDLAGNVSAESYLYLITEKPSVTINAETQVVSSGSYTAKSYVLFIASVAKSGETTIFVRMPNSNEYAQYVAGTKLYMEGTYYSYAIDAAGNVSGTVSITLDNSIPMGTVTSGGVIIESGEYTGKAFSFTAIDNVSGIAKCEIKYPGGTWKTYNGEELAITSGDGWYSFRAYDVAGNISAETRVYLITSAPQTKIYAEAEVVSSGSHTNKKHITFTASSVADFNMYVKIPDMSGYVLYDGAQLTIEGTYYFFAVDITGNVSETIFVTLDKTKPIGNIITESTNGYTNKAFSYTADDSLSGIARYEIKKPNGSWMTYNGDEIKSNAGDGNYAFRAIDLAGNISAENSIYLITTKPTTTIYAGTEAVLSGTCINRNYITFTANSAAGLTMYVKIPSVGGYVIYDGAQLSAEGIYNFYAVDSAGNVSETVTVTLDKSSPTGNITSNGATVQSGGYTNKSFTYAASDNISGISKYEVKRPGGSWEVYTGEEIKANSGDGNYTFRAIDLAGNISIESTIYLATTKPAVTIYAGTEVIQSGSYTNKSYITFSAFSSVSVTMFVKAPGASEYSIYNGLQLNGEGTYYFYSIDITGNQSSTVNVTLDKTKPIGNILSDSINGYTNKPFSYKATDSVSGIEKYEIKHPGGNWETYTGAEIKANAGDGVYVFRAIDFAGNISDESSIYLTTSQLSIIIYAETEVISNGARTNKGYIVFSTASATDATMYVKLPGVSEYIVYKGTQLTGEGVYSLYALDQAGNISETVVVILDKTKPVGVISSESTNGYTNKAFIYTATDTLSGIDRYEIKRPGGNWQAYDGDEIKANSGDGNYAFRAFDHAGNVSAESSIYLITSKPTIAIFAATDAVSSGTNTNKSYVTFTAVSSVSVTLYVKLPNASNYTLYTETQLFGEGTYYFYAMDITGNLSDTINITLDKTKPIGMIASESTSGYTNKAFTYTASDALSGVDRCEIKRPGGNWEIYSGAEIKANSGDGMYAFRTIDLAGNVSDESSIYLTTSQLSIMIYAEGELMPSGAKTNKGNIVFSVVSATEAAMYVKLPGASEYTLYKGTQLNGEGLYSLYALDLAGSVSETVFITLDKTKPVGIIETASVNGYTNTEFSYTATDNLSEVSRCEIKKPGGSWETYTGENVKSNAGEGMYLFRAFDNAGNVSAESSIYLLTTKPKVTIYAGTDVVLSGAKTNKSYISFSASRIAGVTMYVKIPGASNYVIYAEMQLNSEGIYYAYAIDIAGNISDNVSIMLDKENPIGNIIMDGEILKSGVYVNKAFSYSATDTLSGIERYEIKRPGESWQAYDGDEIKANSGDGNYAFRAFDHAGNVSAESSVYLVTSKPTIAIFAVTEAIDSGAITNKNHITFTANSVAGITMYVKMPGTSDYVVYSATQLSNEGSYNFYAIDFAGNISEIVTVTLDKSGPVGAIISEGITVQSGSYINKAFSYSAADSLSEVSRCEIKRPGGNWGNYNGEEIPGSAEGGVYFFRAYDLAGNVSIESSVNFLTLKPNVQLYANESPIDNGTYTNAARISMSASGITDVTCYVRVPGGEFAIYNQYYTYSAAGRYEFYAIDKAGNISDIFVIIIDRNAKPVTLSGVSNGIANGNVSLIWVEGDEKTTANIVSIAVNGYEYQKGDVIQTINSGVYDIKTIDAAGNIWTTTFTAIRIEVLSETLNKEFWETQGKDGKTYSFASYDNALSYATDREAANVRTAVWSGQAWDGGIPMDSIDSANAKNGTYYIYKKSGDKNTEVAYFTLARLNAVIAEYATESINSYFWWERTPQTSAQTENLYSLTLDRTFIGSSVNLASHANYLVDGKTHSGFVYSTEGRHTLTVYDNYGNSYDYTLIIVRTMPNILYALGEGGGNIAAFGRTYYFSEEVNVYISDEFDEFAMFNVYAENGKRIASLSLGEIMVLDASGKYTVQAINHYGLTQVFTLIVSLDAPKAEIIENTKGKKLEIKITESADMHSHIQSMEIYKSIDGGETWVLVDKDDYGNIVSTGRHSYTFRTSGLYKVIIADEFRSGINAIVVQYDYVQEIPEGKLAGVNDGGYTNGKVSFTWTDEAIVTLEKDGTKINYTSGLNLDSDGSYVLTFENYDGYKAIYSFVIDTIAPILTIDGANKGETVNKDVSVSWEEDNLSCEIFENGNLIGEYENGSKLTRGGSYRIVITDAAGNATEVSFTIDKIVDFTIDVNDKGIANSVTVCANEKLDLILEKDGEVISYSFEDTITEEGYYVLILTDELGNTKELAFTIINAPMQKFEYDFTNMPRFEGITVNGQEVELIENILELSEDGNHEICIIVDGQSYILTITIDAIAPTLIINGVENEGSTKGTVKLTDVSEPAEIKVFLDGVEIDYELGISLTQSGKYRVVLEDECGNVTEYSFEILKSVNGGVIALVIIIIIALIGGGAFLFMKKRKII